MRIADGLRLPVSPDSGNRCQSFATGSKESVIRSTGPGSERVWTTDVSK
jgi:hypothetical protein